MNRETSDYIQGILSNRVANLMNSGLRLPGAIDELETASTALVEFARSNRLPDNGSAAITALDLISNGRPHLVELDRFFSKGPGKDTPPHDYFKRLLKLSNEVGAPAGPPTVQPPAPDDQP